MTVHIVSTITRNTAAKAADNKAAVAAEFARLRASGLEGRITCKQIGLQLVFESDRPLPGEGSTSADRAAATERRALLWQQTRDVVEGDPFGDITEDAWGEDRLLAMAQELPFQPRWIPWVFHSLAEARAFAKAVREKGGVATRPRIRTYGAPEPWDHTAVVLRDCEGVRWYATGEIDALGRIVAVSEDGKWDTVVPPDVFPASKQATLVSRLTVATWVVYSPNPDRAAWEQQVRERRDSAAQEPASVTEVTDPRDADGVRIDAGDRVWSWLNDAEGVVEWADGDTWAVRVRFADGTSEVVRPNDLKVTL